MQKKLIVVLSLLLILGLTSCGIEDVIDVLDVITEEKSYTILVYMNGSDLESDGEMASADLLEMISAEYDRENISVVVQTGGTKKWHTKNVPNNKLGRFLIEEDELVPLENLPLSSMGEAETLSDFIDYGVENFPADKYGLIFWNHGGGSVLGYGVDECFESDNLTLTEMKKAFSASVLSENKFEFIGFDACLMATLETAYTVSDYANYLIGSQELEPGYGWDYQTWLEKLGNNVSMDGEELGKAITKSFVRYYKDNDMEGEPTTLSVIRLEKVADTLTALENFIQLVNADLVKGDYNQIAKSRSRAFEFGLPTEYGGSVDMIDIINLTDQFKSEYPDAAKALKKSVKNAVVYKEQGGCESSAGGLSLYFPYSDKKNLAASVKTYQQSGFSDTYIAYVTAFAEKLDGDAMDSIDTSEIMPEQNKKDFQIRLTEKELNNISEIYLTAWIPMGGEDYIQIYEDSNVEIGDDGVITTEFDGIFTSIGGELVCLKEIDSGDDFIKYAAAGQLNGKKVNFIVLYNDEFPDGSVLGALPAYNDRTNMPSKKMNTIKRGDKVCFSYYTAQFTEIDDDEDSNEENEFWFNGDEFTVGNEFEVENSEAEDETYLYGFTIVDCQGNKYYTDYIELSE